MTAAVVILLVAPGLLLLVGTVIYLATQRPKQPGPPELHSDPPRADPRTHA